MTCDVASEAVYVYVEEQIGVAGAHVEKEVEEGGENGDAEIDDGEEGHHLHGAPEGLDELAAQADGDRVDAHLPEVYLEKAEGEGRPYPEGRRQEVTWCDAERQYRLLHVGETVREEDDDTYEFDAGARVAEQCGELLSKVGYVTAQTLYRCHFHPEPRAVPNLASAKNPRIPESQTVT